MRLAQAAASNLRVFGVLLATVAVAFIALGVGLGLALSASDALATHDNPTTIHACVNPLSHIARIIEDPADCAYYEDVVEWSSSAGSAALDARVTALEKQVPDCLSTADAGDANTTLGDAIFEDCNVHVRDGSGDTDGDVTGLGNLIVGYNEPFDEDRSGSHNLVVGPFHSYSSYGGIVAGENNTISGASSNVSGGVLNTASGTASSVSGGFLNTASGPFSTVAGGIQGTASGADDTVIGDSSGAPTFDGTTDSLIFDDTFLP